MATGNGRWRSGRKKPREERRDLFSWPVIVLSILEPPTYQNLAGENKKLARN